MERFAGTEEAADLHRRRAWWLAHVDRFSEAEAEAQRAFDLAVEGDDGGAAVAALTALGMIACFGGRAADGVVHLERAAEFRGADRRRQADARNALGQNLIDLQRFEEAESQLLAALALYGDLSDARGQADVLGMLATLRMERGEPDAAAVDYRRAIEISRSIGWRHGEAVYQMNLGILLVIQGLLGTALEAFDQSVTTYSAMGNRRGLALVLSNAAWMRHAMLGQDNTAEQDTLQALEIYEEIGDLRGEATCQANLGSIAARRNAIESARSLLRGAVSKATQVEDWWLMGQILREFGASELHAGDPREGLKHASEAERICADTGMPDLALSAKALKGRLLLALGQNEDALRETQQAMDQFRPGIELGYLVPYFHSLALASIGSAELSDQYLELAHNELRSTLADLSEADRRSALRNVPIHRELTETWAARRPLQVVHRMAAIDTPSGRPVRTDDMVAVTWTLAAPGDEAIVDRIGRRRHRLLRLLDEADAQGGAPTIHDLADALEASPATVRRDLAALRDDGHPARTRGTRLD
jgi:tetratricopeptide (TPR) repeat protein